MGREKGTSIKAEEGGRVMRFEKSDYMKERKCDVLEKKFEEGKCG